MKLIFNTFVNYKLAPTKGIANDRTTKAFAICLFRDGTHAAVAVGLQQPLREFRVEWGLCAPKNLVGQVFR